MAYGKLDLFDELVKSEAPDDPAFAILLETYFPKEVRGFRKAQSHHRLRREIIATRLSNRMVNLMGPVFHAQMREDGNGMGLLAQAFETAYAVLHFDDIFASINALDGKIPAEAQTLMAVETSANLRLLTNAFLDDPRLSQGSVGAYINRYRAKVHEVRDILLSAVSTVVSSRVEARAEQYKAAGAPDDVAHKVAMVRALASARETVDSSERTGWPLADTAFMQHQVGAQLGMDYLRAATRDLETQDHWDQIALRRIAEDLPRQQGQLTELAIRHATASGAQPGRIDRDRARSLVETWIAPRKASADRILQPATGFHHASKWSLAKLVLLSDALREFINACKLGEPTGKA
jgi:glutamate dehydrogenase